MSAISNALATRSRVLVASADSGFRKRMMTNPLYAEAHREEASGGAHALARMGVSWNYMPSFIDVFEFHHAPQRAQHDPYLVGIISAADQFLAAQASAAAAHQADTAGDAEKSAATETAARSGIHQVSGSTEHSSEVENTDHLPVPQQAVPAFLPLCLPELAESEHRTVMELLETEYLHLVPLVQLGMAVAASDDV
jgi:hypothetical protein